MGMEPDSGEGFRFAARVHLLIEEIGHGRVIELHGHGQTPLPDEDEEFHEPSFAEHPPDGHLELKLLQYLIHGRFTRLLIRRRIPLDAHLIPSC